MTASEDERETLAAEQAEYKRLVGKLGGHKRYLSALANNVANFTDKIDKLEKAVLIEAKELEKTMRDRLILVQGFFDELLENSQTSQDDIDQFEAYMRGIKIKVAKLKFQIESSHVPATEPAPVVQKSTLDGAVKYPELTLPKFSGGPDGVREFRPFYQMFKALVEDKDDIPGIYKVQYLRDCLPEKSEARQLISHIPPTAENYSVHMDTLRSRYENTTGEANRLRRLLMQVGSWPTCNSIESQRKLLDHVQQNRALLSQVDEVNSEDLSCLALNMLSVLPERLKFKAQKLPKEQRTVEAITRIMENSIISRIEVQSFADKSTKPERRLSGVSPAPSPAPKSYLYHSASQSDESKSRPCVYCGESSHTPHKCTKTSALDRAAIISRDRRCWNCLSDDHQVRYCKVASRCNCRQKGKHSPSVCGVTPPWRLQGSK